MVVGDIGLNGKSVLRLVEEVIKEELEYAITQLLNLAVLIVLSIALLLPKIKDVMKARVQVRLIYLFLITNRRDMGIFIRINTFGVLFTCIIIIFIAVVGF